MNLLSPALFSLQGCRRKLLPKLLKPPWFTCSRYTHKHIGYCFQMHTHKLNTQILQQRRATGSSLGVRIQLSTSGCAPEAADWFTGHPCECVPAERLRISCVILQGASCELSTQGLCICLAEYLLQTFGPSITLVKLWCSLWGIYWNMRVFWLKFVIWPYTV